MGTNGRRRRSPGGAFDGAGRGWGHQNAVLAEQRIADASYDELGLSEHLLRREVQHPD